MNATDPSQEELDRLQDQLVAEETEREHQHTEMLVDNRSIYTIKEELDRKTQAAQKDEQN